MEIRYPCVENHIGIDGNIPGDGLHPTSYWYFKEHVEGGEFVDESVGQTFGGEFLRHLSVS